MRMFFHRKVLCALLVVSLSRFAAAGANIRVNCGKGQTIGAAIAKLSVLSLPGPIQITVTGACHENVNVISLDNLTLQAGPSGASITDASGGTLDTVLISDSQRFAMNGFTINGSVDCTGNAVCRTQGNTIQNSLVGWGIRYSRSHGDSVNDVVQTSNGNGFQIVNDSRVAMIDDTVQNNAANGVVLADDGLLILANNLTTTTITNNGANGIAARAHATVRLEVANITGNGNNGVNLQQDAVLVMDFASPFVNSISGNGNSGVHVGDQSFAVFPDDGSAVVAGNLSGTDVVCSGQFPATRGALTNISGGTTNCIEPAPLSPQDATGTKESAARTPSRKQ